MEPTNAPLLRVQLRNLLRNNGTRHFFTMLGLALDDLAKLHADNPDANANLLRIATDVRQITAAMLANKRN